MQARWKSQMNISVDEQHDISNRGKTSRLLYEDRRK